METNNSINEVTSKRSVNNFKGGDGDATASSSSVTARTTEDFQSVRDYFHQANQFDLKFMHVRLVNNCIFVIASSFYVAMDVVPYSGLEPGIDDDDYLPTLTQNWIDRYTILYFIAASLFALTGVIDLYLVKLGRHRSPQDVEEQIINREQARVRARKHRRTRTTDATMMRFMIVNIDDNQEKEEDEEEEEVPNDDDDDDDDDDNDDRMSHTVGPIVEHHSSMYERVLQVKRGCSTVVFVSWALLLGGLFGVASSILVLHNLVTSDILNAVSVHLFFIQACTMFYARLKCGQKSSNDDDYNDNDDDDLSASHNDTTEITTPGQHDDTCMTNGSKWILILGDLSFGLGALIDITWSYVYIYSTSYFTQAIATLISGLLWLLSSILYGIVTVYDYHILRRDINEEEASLMEAEQSELRSSDNTMSR